MYQMLLEAGLGRRKLPHLKALLCGGAPCPEPLIEAYHERGLPLRQGYGLTEVGPNCFTLAPLEGPHRVGSVGRPAFHSEARLVGSDGRDVPPDTPGELWLRGPHVTAGYWNKPEETAKVLDRDGWFHTGDGLRRTEDGFFYVAGRLKDMFISGGENVYPAEVENTLAGHPAVAQVAVLGVPDEKWGQVGLAAIILAEGVSAPESAELRAWTRRRIAAYKVPKHWRFVSEMPLTSSGKIRKDVLVAELWTDDQRS
jgi:fatty-acyl-CoA synthase